MECPVCYTQYNNTNNKPKVAGCGHTICEYCIYKIQKCCICNSPFGRMNRFPAVRRANGFFRDDYMDNYPRMEEFKDNYALKELLEKEKKDYRVCSKSNQYEDFYCSECKELVCLQCMDLAHGGHTFKRVASRMYKTHQELMKYGADLQTAITDNENLLNNLHASKEKNMQISKEAPIAIENIFNKMLVDLCNARDNLLEDLAIEVKEKEEHITKTETSLKDLLAVMRQMKLQVNTLNEYIYESAYQEDDDHISQADTLETDSKAALKEFTASKRQARRNFEVDSKILKIKHVHKTINSEFYSNLNLVTNPFKSSEDFSSILDRSSIISHKNHKEVSAIEFDKAVGNEVLSSSYHFSPDEGSDNRDDEQDNQENGRVDHNGEGIGMNQRPRQLR